MTTLDLHLGPRTRWKGYNCGHHERHQNPNGTVTIKRVPRVHKQIQVTEAEADGLIAASERWDEANKRHDPRGAYNRLIKVENVKRDVGPDRMAKAPGQAFIEQFAEALVERLVSALGDKIQLRNQPRR